MCNYGKDRPGAEFAPECLESHYMSGLDERLDLMADGMALITWRDGDRALYQLDSYATGGSAHMVEFNDEAVRWEKEVKVISPDNPLLMRKLTVYHRIVVEPPA